MSNLSTSRVGVTLYGSDIDGVFPPKYPVPGFVIVTPVKDPDAASN
jgi:hypothetical protein